MSLSCALTLSDEKRIGVLSVLQKMLLQKQRANFFWMTRYCNEVVVIPLELVGNLLYCIYKSLYVKYVPGLRVHAFIFQEFI